MSRRTLEELTTVRYLLMSRAAYIAILGTIVLASAAQLASAATQTVERGSASKSHSSHRRSAQTQRPATKRRPVAHSQTKPQAKPQSGTGNSTLTYADGYRRGFAAGDAAAALRTSKEHCPTEGMPSTASARSSSHTRPSRPTPDQTAPSRASKENPISDAGSATVRTEHPLSDTAPNTGPTAMTLPVALPRTATLTDATLRGSYASLERQNQRLLDDGMERIEDQHDLESRIAHKLLVPLPASAALAVNQNLPIERRYCRPWTARFLADLARAHQAAFHEPLEVSSAVRTVAYQKRLMGINGNAAAAEGDVVSPHLTGAAVDVPKSNLSRQELAWMRSRLLALQQAGKIDVEEEFQQSCFHITVYRSYMEGLPPLVLPSPKAGAGILRASAQSTSPASAPARTPIRRQGTRASAAKSTSLRHARLQRNTDLQSRVQGSKPRAGVATPADPARAPTKPARPTAQPTEVVVEGL